MGEAKRRKIRESGAEKKESVITEWEATLADLEQQVIDEAIEQKPFYEDAKKWVCHFGADYLGVDSLSGCLGLVFNYGNGKKRHEAEEACLKKGYWSDELNEIQWNPKKAEEFLSCYKFYESEDGSLVVAP